MEQPREHDEDDDKREGFEFQSKEGQCFGQEDCGIKQEDSSL